MTKRSLTSSERQSQRTVVEYVRLKYPDVVIFAIPNGGSRNKIEAANLKKDGVLAGVPDLFVAYPKKWLVEKRFFYMEHPGLFIEMKSQKGHTSLMQQKIIWKLVISGYRVEVCYSADEAIKVIDEYLS